MYSLPLREDWSETESTESVAFRLVYVMGNMFVDEVIDKMMDRAKLMVLGWKKNDCKVEICKMKIMRGKSR